MAPRKNTLWHFCFSFCFCMISSYSETDTLKQGHRLKDGEYLVSAGSVFTLGFFSSQEEKTIGYFNPESAQNRYIGIWYTYSKDKKPVWVANRNKPISRASGAIEIDSKGVLKISDNGFTSVLLNLSPGTARADAVLTDTGNFVLQEQNSDGMATGKILWQSFDYPTDTLLPGMRLGFNFRTGKNWSLTSWVSDDVPALGPFTLGADPNGTNQLFMWRRGENQWRSGGWHEGKFSNFIDYLYSFDYVSNKDERYFRLSAVNTWYVSFPMYQLDGSGVINNMDVAESGRSSSYLSEVINCKSQYDGHKIGCVEQKLPDCRSNIWFDRTKGYVISDGFKYEGKKYIMGLADCEAKCLSTCSCVGYANIYPNGTGCELWHNRTQLVEDGYKGYRLLYIERQRPNLKGKKMFRWIWLIIATAVLVALLLIAWLGYRMQRMLLKIVRFFGLLGYILQHILKSCLWKLHNHFQCIADRVQTSIDAGANQTEEKTFSELESRAGESSRFRRRRKLAIGKKRPGVRVFSFNSMVQATANFSLSNMLGEGGYGIVYKGILEDSQEIAIKRLSKSSRQGRLEFVNEIKLVAKLQHTNLVKLIGCCIEQGEKIVVYEYMHNKSLDYFLFDSGKKLLLDWKKRFNIIEGVAQGLLYLHKYSRVKIIHRDLKTGNILLDQEMNPKISDFGMARLFEHNESGANTNKPAGTLGYMSPEYALDGYFSVKSDVFSFGVLLLEIIRSEKNNRSYCSDRPLNLIGYAWELWIENKGSEFIDRTLILSDREHEEAMKCINIGLLCVQEHPEDRPTMSTIVTMISSDTKQLPNPKKPAYFSGNGVPQANHQQYDLEQGSLNDASISEWEGR